MNNWFGALAPALITFGPMCIAFSVENEALGPRIAGYLGALALGVGLVFMFRVMRIQQNQIDALNARLQGSSTGR